MKNLFTILGLVMAFNAFGQNIPSSSELQYRSVYLYPNMDKVVQGTPYIYPDYVLGRVEGFPESYKMRYNANIDEINFKKGDQDLALLKDKPYGTVNFKETNEIIKLEQYIYKNNTILGYLFVVADKDNLKIFKKSTISYSPFVAAKNSYDIDKPAAYKKLPDVYFIKKGNGEIVEMPSNKNKLIDMFPEKKEAVNQYFKNNKVNLSDGKDLKKLAEIL
ncbi:hypothetical protein QGN23_08535 [Chryseobacterium gotjawalense]|uniref:GLPGLI family protein n=1 Tax=Chryseobacterium gotjawalense TaxID=3042315 RepID=A0ABY8RBB4_9FLAO|nr:hypothetical protein [Chryseobacterium sp. wdc7]WHF50483.1 hypothetical protein QGN23_08535 [Chryseobacterium sp. wdc7]